jgi:hypothetical protein
MPEVNARTVVTGLLVIADRIATYWHARKQWVGSGSTSWVAALDTAIQMSAAWQEERSCCEALLYRF